MAAALMDVVSLQSIIVLPVVMSVPLVSGLVTRTTSWTDPAAPTPRLPTFQITLPEESDPPPVADTRVVSAGTAAEMTTPVADALPVFM
jgi:hypothetical protein